MDDWADVNADVDDIDKIRFFNGRLQQCRRYRSRIRWHDLSISELTTRLLESRRTLRQVQEREDRLMAAIQTLTERVEALADQVHRLRGFG